MTTRGRSLRFGLSLDPEVGRLAQARRLAAAADRNGLDLLAVQDHPNQPGHLDAPALIGDLAGHTERISFFTDVADLQLRPAPMLAKTAASLSVLSGGRFQLGVGGGAFPDVIARMGAPARRGAAMVSYTEESLRVLRDALAGGVVRPRGTDGQPTGYQAGPVPPAPVELWVGCQGPQMLSVTGRAGDGWVCPLNIYVPPEEVPARQRIIDEAARAAGRDPAEVRRVYNVLGSIGAGGGHGLTGSVAHWVDTLTDWATRLRFDTVVFWPISDAEEQAELFAVEVAPQVRKRVADEGGRA